MSLLERWRFGRQSVAGSIKRSAGRRQEFASRAISGSIATRSWSESGSRIVRTSRDDQARVASGVRLARCGAGYYEVEDHARARVGLPGEARPYSAEDVPLFTQGLELPAQ